MTSAMDDSRPAAPAFSNARQAKAFAAWQELNKRQQLYLTAIYEADQAAEADIADRRRRMYSIPPADEWRWLNYYPGIWARVDNAGERDPGTGSTLAALERRDLIHVREIQSGTAVQIRLRTAGRAAARAGIQEQAPRRTPAGLLSEWLWDALATIYRAGETGCYHDAWHLKAGDPLRGPSWNACLKLRDRKDGKFIEEFQPNGIPGEAYRTRLTARGRDHAELHHRCYTELYPTVRGIELTAPVAAAHEGLAVHSIRRPKYLVTGPDWRLLAILTRMEKTHRCPWRDHVAREYRGWGSRDRPVPAWVDTIPDGLTLPAAAKAAGSTASIGRLEKYDGGPLIENVEVKSPDGGRLGQAQLVCLTNAGREHVTDHLPEYRQFYPDIPTDAV